MKERIVITGATSFLGEYMARRLAKGGATVYAIVRPQSSGRDKFKDADNIVTVYSSMGEPEKWMPQIDAATHFVHFGWEGVGRAVREDVETQRRNIRDTLKCLDAAIRLGCSTFTFAGSQAEYGIHTEVIREDTPCVPVNQYGKAKLEVFRQAAPLAENAGIKWYQTRIFSSYGVGDHPWSLVPSCIRTFCDGGEIALSSCRQYWNFMHVEDTIEAMTALMHSGAAAGVYNVAGKDTRVLKSFIEDIYNACDGKGTYTLAKEDPARPAVNLRPDISLLESVIGEVPASRFDVRIGEMVRSYKSAGRL